MSNLTTALIIVMCINLMLFFGQIAVNDINPGTNFYNAEDSALCRLDPNNCRGSSYSLNVDPSGDLPSGESTIQSETEGTPYTDTFSASKTFFLTRWIKYLTQILGAPMNFLQALGLPNAFAFGVGALWYGITLFLIVAFIFGRDA